MFSCGGRASNTGPRDLLEDSIPDRINKSFGDCDRQHKRHRRNTCDSTEIFLVSSVLLLFLLPLPMSFVSVFYDLDPFYLIFELYIFPIPYDRFFYLSAVNMFLRLLLSAICILEFTRFWATYVCIVIIMFRTLISILNKIFLINSRRACRIYTQLRLVCVHVMDFVNLNVAILVFVGHIVLVLLAWISFCCKEELPLEPYVLTLIVVLIVLIMVVIFFTFIAQIPLLSMAFLQRKLISQYKIIAPDRCGRLYKAFRAQRVIVFSCLHFFPMFENILPIFMRHLSDNIINAIVLL